VPSPYIAPLFQITRAVSLNKNPDLVGYIIKAVLPTPILAIKASLSTNSIRSKGSSSS